MRDPFLTMTRGIPNSIFMITDRSIIGNIKPYLNGKFSSLKMTGSRST
jgi:hypothetical protein